MTTFTRILALLVITPILGTAEAASDWAEEIAISASEIQASDADFYNGVLQADPIATRAGYPRFVGEWTRDERAAPLMLQRLLEGDDHPAVQAALVEALPRTGGEWDDAIAALWEETDSATVRRMMVLTLEEADANVAFNALRTAANSDDAEIRAAAVRAMTWRKDADRFTSVFIAGMQDRNDDVRSLAARASGLHKVEAAKRTLAGMLDSESRDDVRLTVLIALSQIDAEYARSLSAVTRLAQDADQKIARTAHRILTP
jgi:hypothetical protein